MGRILRFIVTIAMLGFRIYAILLGVAFFLIFVWCAAALLHFFFTGNLPTASHPVR